MHGFFLIVIFNPLLFNLGKIIMFEDLLQSMLPKGVSLKDIGERAEVFLKQQNLILEKLNRIETGLREYATTGLITVYDEPTFEEPQNEQ